MQDLLKQALGLLNLVLNQNKKQYMVQLEECTKLRYMKCDNKFATKNACKHFSQSDEDGITLEACKRVGLNEKSTFFEIGVGNGLENNTLSLLAMGWSGTWLGAEKLAINTNKSKRLKFKHCWVSKENIVELYQASLKAHNTKKHDVISIDVDGNDYWFVKELLDNGARPELLICEYNGIFPPGAHWVMPYDSKHLDRNVDPDGHYSGASFSSLIQLMAAYKYIPVACNPMTGVNMFFVDEKHKEKFLDIPQDQRDLYVRPFYHGHLPNFYHKVSPMFIESII